MTSPFDKDSKPRISTVRLAIDPDSDLSPHDDLLTAGKNKKKMNEKMCTSDTNFNTGYQF
jgi:hypothetical protein